jgi:hypothetical protein
MSAPRADDIIIRTKKADSSRKSEPQIILPSSESFQRLTSKARYYSFIPCEETFSKPLNMPPGLYSFVQTKLEPKTIFLHMIVAYEGSAHSFLARSLVKMQESDLYTAGELIISARGKIAAWSFRTGSYDGLLNIHDRNILACKVQNQSSKLDLCGLPKDCFYFAELWTDYSKSGFTKCFFDMQGRFRLVSNYSQIVCDMSQGIPDKFDAVHRAVESIAIELGAVAKGEAGEQKGSDLSIQNLDLASLTLSSSAPVSTRNNSFSVSTVLGPYSLFGTLPHDDIMLTEAEAADAMNAGYYLPSSPK